LGNIFFLDESGLHYFAILDSYNKRLKEVCNINQWTAIDAADSIAPNSNNYYDYFHYTKAGSDRMASAIYNELNKIIPNQ
jgi:hypothetical protein